MTSFCEAFRDRYLDTGDLDVEELRIKGKEKYTKDLVVELVGRERAIDTFKNLRNLRQIVLSNCEIKCANNNGVLSDDAQSPNEELKSNLRANQSIHSLDISCNQIDSWIEIVRIVELFPYLEELIITGNPFESIDLDHLEWQVNVLSRISNLVAGKLRIKWSSIELFDKLFINLKSLNIFNNNLNDLQLHNCSSFENLDYLSLSENQVGWSNVLKLKQLENLKHLQLDCCSIEEIVLDDRHLFINLNQLNLSNNHLVKWSHISELSKLTNLTDLSIRDNPLFKDQDYDMIFNFTVGILKSLKVLNKQIVTVDKRKEAEVYFLRTNFKAWSNGQLKEWNVEQRFNELIELYGKPVDLLKDVQVNKFLIINLMYEQRSIEKKLLKSMDISTLRMLVKRLFRFNDQTDFELLYLNDDNQSLEFKFDQDKNLEFYPINDKCTIKVRLSS